MASETTVIPDLYFPEDDQELQTSSVEGKDWLGQGGELEGGNTVDLIPEGFIPIHKLTLGDLPESIRTQEHLQYILDVSKNVVRINNNGLSDKRPDDDQFKKRKQKAMRGSGLLAQSGGNPVILITNEHVLFNEEELHNASFDVFYDYRHGDPDDKEKLVQRCGRKRGRSFGAKHSKDDIAMSIFTVKDVMGAHIREHCSTKVEEGKRAIKIIDQQHRFSDRPSRPPIACLISHPLGQHKHVSFGEMVDYNMLSRTVHHTAPSKPGSSGGRVIVFEESLLAETIFHVGNNPRNDKKTARVYHAQFSALDFTIPSHALLGEASHAPEKEETTSEQRVHEASASLQTASLVACLPIFGAFLLHTEETRFVGLNTSALKPCKPFLTDASVISHDRKQSVKEELEKLARLAPSFNVCLSKNLDNTSDLVSLLESQGPCFCQSIIKMMERGVTLEDGSVTECYLSPYTAAAKMSSDSDVTWPWLNRSRPDLRNDVGAEACLMKKCLELCDKDIVLVALLLLITQVNLRVKTLCFQSCDASSTMTHDDSESQWETVFVRTTQVHPCEQSAEKRPGETRDSPPLTREKNLKSSTVEIEGNWDQFTEDVLIFTSFAFKVMTDANAMRIFNEHQTACSQQKEGDDLTKLYSRFVALSEHALQHERQTHPYTERDGGEDGSGSWCHYGRPGTSEVINAQTRLRCTTRFQTASGINSFLTKLSEELPIVAEHLSKSSTYPAHFYQFLRDLQQTASEKSLPPGPFILATLDKMDAFPHGRHSLMLFLASREVLLYNVCLFARHISKQLQPDYFAFPVSVFGRPGNWPGNVTPPEVQRTAWRLIQDAIKASGFSPAVLSALEEDADRREKLIDLYVDMKQLKWKGRIQSHLFGKYLALSKKKMGNHLQTKQPFNASTHYIVWYAAFLVCPETIACRSFTSQPHPLK